MRKIFFSAVLCIGFRIICDAQMIPCSEATLFIGRDVTICGQVKSAMRDTFGHKSGMLLGLCIPYPNQPVMIVIKDQTLPLFPYDATTWPGKWICVSGQIKVLHGRPFIEVHKRTQIVI
ncbi:MAG TPA: hypothetical protein VE978_20285 [Chitinophagales bacterium]|nr:hypothetical protein [Chitinophagales bacterium]